MATKKTSPTFVFYGWVATLVLLIGLGVYAYYFQTPLARGLIVTGLRDGFPWGFYIQNFMFFVGLAAGGLVVYASVYIFDAQEFKPLSKLAVLQALVCTMLAALFVLIDLGRPERVFWFLLSPNFSSIFVFDFIILNTYLAICAIALWLSHTGKGSPRFLLGMAIVSLTAAISMHSITAWVLGFVRGEELWNTALMAPLFVSSAVVSGLALLILMSLLVSKFTGTRFKDEIFFKMGKILAVVVLVDLFFLLAETMTALWPGAGKPSYVEMYSLLLTGKYAPLFLSQVFLFGLLPFALLVIPRIRRSIPVIALASVLLVIGVFIKRFILLAKGLGVSAMGEVTSYYIPTFQEVLVGVGLWAVGALIITLGVKLLNIKAPEVKTERGRST